MYRKLGMAEEALELWRKSSMNYRVSGNNFKMRMSYMRKTGDASTSIGNFITNLCCHRRVLNWLLTTNQLCYYLGLGDDVLIASMVTVDEKLLAYDIKRFFNMESKAVLRTQCGVFLRLIVYN